MATTMKPCWKCGGKGEIVRFNHHHHGVCFVCKGKGEIRATVTTASAKAHMPTTAPSGETPEWYTANPYDLPF